MLNEEIIKLQHFFEADIKIKKEMFKVAPPTEYTDFGSVSRYTEDLDDFLMYAFSELKCIASDIFGLDSVVMKKIAMLDYQIKNKFYSCGYDIDKLCELYKNNISSMKPDFINTVKEECVGYSRGGTESVVKANTINEMLHYMHSYVVNNEDILQALPAINEKKNIYEYPITLRGYNVPVFDQLFTAFPVDLRVAWTDMVAISERKLLMLVRDRGHALSIEITLNGQNARLEYFIPKLCNVDMINNLPGVNRVNENSVGATGVVESPIEELPHTLYNFISKVPMDGDMVIQR
jgi:hypothetical protein